MEIVYLSGELNAWMMTADAHQHTVAVWWRVV